MKLLDILTEIKAFKSPTVKSTLDLWIEIAKDDLKLMKGLFIFDKFGRRNLPLSNWLETLNKETLNKLYYELLNLKNK